MRPAREATGAFFRWALVFVLGCGVAPSGFQSRTTFATLGVESGSKSPEPSPPTDITTATSVATEEAGSKAALALASRPASGDVGSKAGEASSKAETPRGSTAERDAVEDVSRAFDAPSRHDALGDEASDLDDDADTDLVAASLVAPRPEPFDRHRPEATGEPYTPGEGLLQLPSASAFDPFYEALWRTEKRESGAITRVMHMGDSSIGLDQFPHMLRGHFGRRFGNAGAGFVLMQPHSDNYRNALTGLRVRHPWDFCFIIRRCREDGHYGLGGVSFRNRGLSESEIRMRNNGPGSRADRFELWYAAQPGGGRLAVQIDGNAPVLLDTNAETLEDRWHTISLPRGKHSFRVKAAGGGPVRVYGAVIEDRGPGVVWDTLSMIGAFMRRLLGYDADHFGRQIDHRRPDMLVLNYGGNDMRRIAMARLSFPSFQGEIEAVIGLLRKHQPTLPCLLVGVNDRRRSGQQTIDDWLMHRTVETQRTAALAQGCGYFDTYRAMGGHGSFERWLRRGQISHDGTHLTFDGRQIIARLLYSELMAGYERWKERTGKAPKGPLRATLAGR